MPFVESLPFPNDRGIPVGSRRDDAAREKEVVLETRHEDTCLERQIIEARAPGDRLVPPFPRLVDGLALLKLPDLRRELGEDRIPLSVRGSDLYLIEEAEDIELHQ